MTRTRFPLSRANRSAMTLPANPAPTTTMSWLISRLPRSQAGRRNAGRDREAADGLRGTTSHRAPLAPRPPLEDGGDERVDGCPRAVPRPLREQRVGCSPVTNEIRLERALARREEALRAIADLDEALPAARIDHVGDARACDRETRGEVFGRLRRADEAGRLVVGERHDPDVPAGEVGRQLAIRLRPEVVDVRRVRERRGIDLDDRPEHDELPVRVCR